MRKESVLKNNYSPSPSAPSQKLDGIFVISSLAQPKFSHLTPHLEASLSKKLRQSCHRFATTGDSYSCDHCVHQINSTSAGK